MKILEEVASSRADVASAPPFFIVGSGRSGSTLLRMMLASHSRLAIPPETWFLLPLVERMPLDRALTREELDQAISLMTGHYRWSDMKMGVEEFRDRAAHLKAPSVRNLVEIVYGIHLNAVGKQRWGDKTPPYVRIVPQLATIFPAARFIYLVRDGRDVARSFQSLMIYGRTIHQNTIEWLDANRWVRTWMASQYAESIIRVRYEDLVVDTENTLCRICEFIGEQYEPQMLSWRDDVEHLVPQREIHVHKKLKRASSQTDIERWRREMSSREMFVAESFLHRDLLHFGYECRFRARSWRPLFWLTRLYCIFVWPVIPERAVWFFMSRLGRKSVRSDVHAAKSSDSLVEDAGRVRQSAPVPRAVNPSRQLWKRIFK